MQYPVQQQQINSRREDPISGIFNDDEPLQPESVKKIGAEGKIDIEIRAQRSQVKLG